MVVFGIDCGVSGAVAALEDGEFKGVRDLPLWTHLVSNVKWADPLQLQEMFRELAGTSSSGRKPSVAFVESIHFVQKGGVLHSPVILGSVLAALAVWGCAIHVVQASVWKRDLGLLAPSASDRERKLASLERARRLFPAAELERVKDHNRAEALLIAHYGVCWRRAQEAA